MHDVAVIGGGVVGCAVLRAFALAGARAVLLERAADILDGASKGNSAILHTGFDAPPDSLEAACIRAGYAEYQAIRHRLNLPLLESGGLVVAWRPEEFARLDAIAAGALRNGVGNVARIDAIELARREPNLARDALGALLVPDEHLIDPWSAPLAYALQALANGSEIRRGCRVEAGRLVGETWHLTTTTGEVAAGVVVNCAGLQGDLVEAIARPSPFAIRPRKGQFVVFDKTAFPLIRSILLPVPNERTKGVVLTRTIFGNLMIGPTADEQDDREVAAVDRASLERLLAQAHRMVPALAGHAVTATFAGLRPATEFKDYRIEALADRRWITVGGIRSTGLTGSLGIARHVLDLHARHFGGPSAPADPLWTPVPNIAETAPRPWQQPGQGRIVCHCELVTEREIEAALAGPLPAGDIGGLRRRTRCMMGRCQGFYCSARVAELAAFPGASAA